MKSPSLIVVILFSWISNFFKLSIVCRAPVGTRFNSLPPMFKRLSFLRTEYNNNDDNNTNMIRLSRVRVKAQKERCIVIMIIYIVRALNCYYFSVPANALGSMFVRRFSYNVSISSVLIPSKAFAWMAEILLWFKLNISNRSKLFSAGVGTLLNEFWDRSSWVSAFPKKQRVYYYYYYYIVLRSNDRDVPPAQVRFRTAKSSVYAKPCRWYIEV